MSTDKNVERAARLDTPTLSDALDKLGILGQCYKVKPRSSDFRMSSMFAELGDSTALQVVNQAQQEHVANYVKKNLPQYAALPVLSVLSLVL
mgnify:CR=1 FL=1